MSAPPSSAHSADAQPGGSDSLTLKDLHDQLVALQKQLPPPHESMRLKRLSDGLRRQKRIWMPVAWAVSILGLFFSTGMAWAIWVGANATDDEVQSALEHTMGIHNVSISQDTHSDMRGTLGVHTEELEQLKKQGKSMDLTLKRLDKRSLYQFEFVRWQAEVIECERSPRCRRPPRKPQRVKDLESDLMND